MPQAADDVHDDGSGEQAAASGDDMDDSPAMQLVSWLRKTAQKVQGTSKKGTAQNFREYTFFLRESGLHFWFIFEIYIHYRDTS